MRHPWRLDGGKNHDHLDSNGGGDPAAAQQTAEIIDLSAPAPAWMALPNLNRPRAQQVNTVLLPDGRVFLAGGIDGADGGPAEILDARNPAAGWELCATMSISRAYHSVAILLVDALRGRREMHFADYQTMPSFSILREST